MNLVVDEIEKIEPIFKTSKIQIEQKIHMQEHDMFDFMCEICEQIGDEKFKEWVNQILS